MVPKTPSGMWWRAGLIAACVCLAYSNSLSGPFILDDELSIVENSDIREWWRLGAILSPPREFPTAGRPLVNLSFALNYALGGLSVRGYHAANIALHLLCALLIFGIVRRTLELPGVTGRSGAWSLNTAMAASLLWALHPLNTEAVNYVTQRTQEMMALCYLATLYAGIRAFPAGERSKPHRRARFVPRESRGWQVVGVVSCVAGMACKESMVTAPLMVVMYDSIFLFGSASAALKRRRFFYAGLAASWVVLAALLWSGPRARSAGFASGVSPWTYLLDQTVMITRYLRLAVWPRDLVVNYGWPFPATLHDVLPESIFLTSLLALAMIALNRRPTWGFLGAWFFITLAPASSIVPIATEVGAERRMYLPLVALVVLMAVGVSRIMRAGAAVVAVVLVVGALGTVTFARNRQYRSELALASSVVERYPTGVAHHWLGTQLLDAGKRDDAIAHLRIAVRSAPRAHYTLGVEYFNEGRLDEAIGELRAFVRAQPLLLEAVGARQMLGWALAERHQWSDAIGQYRKVLTMNPSTEQLTETQVLLGRALFATGSFGEASARFAAYLRARPSDVDAMNDLGVCFIAMDRLDDGIEVLRRVIDLDPDNVNSHRNLANAFLARRDIARAAAHARRAVALRADDSGVHDVLGRVLAVQGKIAEAEDEFRRALEIDPGDKNAQDDFSRLRQPLAGRTRDSVD